MGVIAGATGCQGYSTIPASSQKSWRRCQISFIFPEERAARSSFCHRVWSSAGEETPTGVWKANRLMGAGEANRLTGVGEANMLMAVGRANRLTGVGEANMLPGVGGS